MQNAPRSHMWEAGVHQVNVSLQNKLSLYLKKRKEKENKRKKLTVQVAREFQLYACLSNILDHWIFFLFCGS